MTQRFEKMISYAASILKEEEAMDKFKLTNLFDPRLPFPTKTIQLQNDTIEVYIIPEEKKAEVLKKLYPFIPVPSLDDEMLDIHADKKFIVRDFCVTREGQMNLLVSPYYFESGGTVIDWWPEDSED
jgi:hypothetical protein